MRCRPRRTVLETMEILLEHGADPNLASAPLETTSRFRGPLECVPRHSRGTLRQDRLNLLLAYGARPRVWQVAPPGDIAIVAGCVEGDVGTVRSALESAEVLTDPRTGDTAYHGLAWTKDPEVIKQIADLLVERGLDPNTGPNMAGLTALGVAFRRRASTALCVLLDLGVKIPPIYTKRGCLHCRPYTTYVYHLLVRAGLQPTQQAAADMLINTIKHNNQRLYEFLVRAHPLIVHTFLITAHPVITTLLLLTDRQSGATISGVEVASGVHDVEQQLKEDRCFPPTLAALTVFTIRKYLFTLHKRQSILSLVHRLPVPKRMHRLLLMEDMLNEDMISVVLCDCE